MKKLTVVALALTAAFQAQAVEVYKNDSTLLDLYGRIYAGQFFGEKKELDANGDITNEYSDKQGANQFVRLGAKVESGSYAAVARVPLSGAAAGAVPIGLDPGALSTRGAESD